MYLCIFWLLKAILHETIFPATCNAAKIALQVAKTIARVTTHLRKLRAKKCLIALQVARKVELSFARQVAACNMSSAARNARCVASCRKNSLV